MNLALSALLDGSQWLMEPRAFRKLITRAAQASQESIVAAQAAYQAREVAPRMVGDIAVINAFGPITYRSSWMSLFFGGVSIEDLQQQLRSALSDPAVKTIVIRWDSPGGNVEMINEFGDELFAARGVKPVLSVADTTIASAAYWLASQTDAIHATVSSRLGSIGVYCEHDDISGLLEKQGVKITLVSHGVNKVEGNPYEPLGDGALAQLQSGVDEVGAEFEAAVARGRGVTRKVVLDTFGQGRVYRGKQAIALGMADKLTTFGTLLGKLTKTRSASQRAAELAPVALANAVADLGHVAAASPFMADDTEQECADCSADCPCESPACEEDCPTCGAGCACGGSQAAAKVAEQAIQDEHAAIVASLTADA